MTFWLRRARALVLAATLVALGCTADEPRNSDEAAAAAVIERFVMEMFSDSGNSAVAFELIEPADRPNCDNKEFADVRDLGRTLVSGRRLSVDIDRVVTSDNRGTVAYTTSIDGRVGLGLDPPASVVKVDGRWYYRISDGPGCDPPYRYFGMEAGVRVTPVSQGNPACHAAYPFDCIPPPPPILSCDDIEFPLISVVEHPDPHGLDVDGDGFGCE
jgi:hypothetical protein